MIQKLLDLYKPAPITVKLYLKNGRLTQKLDKAHSFAVYFGRELVFPKSEFLEGLKSWEKQIEAEGEFPYNKRTNKLSVGNKVDLIGSITYFYESLNYFNYVMDVEKEVIKSFLKEKSFINKEKLSPKVKIKYKELKSKIGQKYKKPIQIREVITQSKKYKKELNEYNVLSAKFLDKRYSGYVRSVQVTFSKDEQLLINLSNVDTVWNDFQLLAKNHLEKFFEDIKKIPKKKVSAYFIIKVRPIYDYIRDEFAEDIEAISFSARKISDVNEFKRYFKDILSEEIFNENLKAYILAEIASGFVIEGFEIRATFQDLNVSKTKKNKIKENMTIAQARAYELKMKLEQLKKIYPKGKVVSTKKKKPSKKSSKKVSKKRKTKKSKR